MSFEFKKYIERADEDTHIIKTECRGKKYYGEWRETVRFNNNDFEHDVYELFEDREFDSPFAGRFQVPERATAEQRADIFDAYMQMLAFIDTFEDGYGYNYDREREQEWMIYYSYVDHVMNCEVVKEAA